MMHRWLVCAILFALGAGSATAFARRTHTAGSASAAQPAATPQPPKTYHLQRHPVVALTFDDLPAAGSLPPGDNRVRILTTLTEELKAHHLKGVYGFVNAVSLPGDQDAQQALRIWLAAGMNIGSHTWDHPSLTDNTAAFFEHDIALNEPLLAQFAGNRDWHWFRFPYLEEGDTLAKRNDVRAWLQSHGYRVAQVTLNFDDDSWNDPYARCMARHDTAAIAWLKQSYLENAAEFLRVGREEELTAFGHEVPNVLLLHGTAFTTLMLPDLLKILHQQGFRFASLPKVESNPIYFQNVNAALKNGGSLPNQYLDSRNLPYPPLTEEPYDKLHNLCR
jgi:peptidoglycan/xylan/chitin deacetylase (PgdA/CDA1 family)